MKRHAVESSTMLSLGYDVGSRILEIEFESGLVYRYHQVPILTYRQLEAADSKGRYFNAHIRNTYAYTRL